MPTDATIWQIATMCEFRICPLIYNRTQFPHLYHVGNPHFVTLFPVVLRQDANFSPYHPFQLQLASMCVLTICWGHVGIEAAKPENPDSPIFWWDLPTASCLQVKASNSVWQQLDPDLVLSGYKIPTH